MGQANRPEVEKHPNHSQQVNHLTSNIMRIFKKVNARKDGCVFFTRDSDVMRIDTFSSTASQKSKASMEPVELCESQVDSRLIIQ